MYIYVLLALFCGATTVTSGVLNSAVDSRLGTYKSAFVNYFMGLIPSVIYSIYFIATNDTKVSFVGVPIFLYLSGILSVIVVLLCNIVYKKISAVVVTLLIFIGQILTGTIVDYLIFDKDVSVLKIIGILLITAGIYINLLIDNKNTVQE